MTSPPKGKPAPGMIAVGAGLFCALVAGIFVRDFSSSELVRLAVPIVAALLGIVAAFKLLEARSKKP